MNKPSHNLINKVFYSAMLPCFVLLLMACNSKPRERMIADKDLADIIYDAYIADGMLAYPDIRNLFSKRDSIENHVDIIKEHGYTRAEMERTLNWLFMKKPDRLLNIYDRVMTRLTELESSLIKIPYEASVPDRKYWKGEKSYLFPGTTDKQMAYFSQTLTGEGTFTLRYGALISPADETYGTGFFGWTCDADSVLTGKKHYLPRINYLKDGSWQTYYVNVDVKSDRPLVFSGYLYFHWNTNTPGALHGVLTNLTMTFASHLQ
jgi:Domain of unknown function (DUF4296)